MARILLIANFHPNEAVAIKVAKETAKILRAMGHEVFVRKIPFKYSGLSRIFRAKKKLNSGNIFSETESWKAVGGFQKEIRADVVYDFHCSSSDNKAWRKGGGADFEIRYLQDAPVAKYHLVDLKAAYQSLPRRVASKINKNTAKAARQLPLFHTYFRRTANLGLTKKAGLDPKMFAQTIASEINKQQTSQRGSAIKTLRVRRKIPRHL